MKGPIDRYGSPRGSTTSGVLRRHTEKRERCASFVSGGANWVEKWVGFLGTTYFTCPLLLVQSVMIGLDCHAQERERESTHAQGLLAYIY